MGDHFTEALVETRVLDEWQRAGDGIQESVLRDLRRKADEAERDYQAEARDRDRRRAIAWRALADLAQQLAR